MDCVFVAAGLALSFVDVSPLWRPLLLLLTQALPVGVYLALS